MLTSLPAELVAVPQAKRLAPVFEAAGIGLIYAALAKKPLHLLYNYRRATKGQFTRTEGAINLNVETTAYQVGLSVLGLLITKRAVNRLLAGQKHNGDKGREILSLATAFFGLVAAFEAILDTKLKISAAHVSREGADGVIRSFNPLSHAALTNLLGNSWLLCCLSISTLLCTKMVQQARMLGGLEGPPGFVQRLLTKIPGVGSAPKQCTICLEEITCGGVAPCIEDSGHQFHRACIERVTAQMRIALGGDGIQIQAKWPCPQCRGPMYPAFDNRITAMKGALERSASLSVLNMGTALLLAYALVSHRTHLQNVFTRYTPVPTLPLWHRLLRQG